MPRISSSSTGLTNAVGRWHRLAFSHGPMASASSSVYVLHPGGGVALAAAGGARAGLYLDPADFSIPGYTTSLRVRGRLVTNAVAPAADFYFDLQPVATWNGASGAFPGIATLGASLGRATIAAPAASAAHVAASAEFAFPAAGHYTLVLSTSTTTAANAQGEFAAELQLRHVPA